MKESNRKSKESIYLVISSIAKIVMGIALILAFIVIICFIFYKPDSDPSFVCNVCDCCDQTTSSKSKAPEEKPFEELVRDYVFDICQNYPNVDPSLVLSVIYQESRFKPNVSSGNCVGLMQVSTYWHRDRGAKLGVNDFLDPYSNILIGVDLLNELIIASEGDIYKALTRYNGGSRVGSYAIEVVQRAAVYEEEHFYV